jgi:hypothetical protein
MFGTDPLLQMVDTPPNPHDVGQGLSDVRYCAPVPFCYFHHYLRPLTPREAFEVVYTDIVANGDLDWALPFLHFLAFACQRSVTAPAGLDHVHCGHAPLIAPRIDPWLHRKRWSIATTKLPGLSLAPQTMGANQTVGAVGHMTQELRLSRTEAPN